MFGKQGFRSQIRHAVLAYQVLSREKNAVFVREVQLEMNMIMKAKYVEIRVKSVYVIVHACVSISLQADMCKARC